MAGQVRAAAPDQEHAQPHHAVQTGPPLLVAPAHPALARRQCRRRRTPPRPASRAPKPPDSASAPPRRSSSPAGARWRSECSRCAAPDPSAHAGSTAPGPVPAAWHVLRQHHARGQLIRPLAPGNADRRTMRSERRLLRAQRCPGRAGLDAPRRASPSALRKPLWLQSGRRPQGSAGSAALSSTTSIASRFSHSRNSAVPRVRDPSGRCLTDL